MKRKLKTVPKPTKKEAATLNKFIWMADWHFDCTIKKKCAEISSYIIRWEDGECEKAFVYGLQAIKTITEEPCIANIFIRYSSKVYQTTDLKSITEIIALLKKEAEFDDYNEKLDDQRWKKRQKLLNAKKKKKFKVKKLRLVKVKAA